MQGWMKGYIYFPDFTIDCLTDYAKQNCICKNGCKEGVNLHRANHV